MTGHTDFDRTLTGWFEADALSPAPAGDLDRVLDATRRRSPRPAWLATLGAHWVGAGADVRLFPPFRLRWSTAIVLILVVAAFLGGAILIGARILQPSPQPTGRLGHLAYVLDGDIFVADWDGRNAIRIADGVPGGGPGVCGSFWGEGPMWSPDGSHLAYRSAWEENCPGTIGDGKVFVSDPGGHVVVSFPGTGWLVSWSPDSSRVATWVELDKAVGIYGLDGVRQALLTVPPGCKSPGDFDPVWSPDGTSLVIAACVVPVDGRAPRRASSDDPRSHHAAYSRDGTHVVFNDGGFLVVAAADGTHRRLLAERTDSIVWSPTGDRVAFTWSFDAGGPNNLRVMEVANGNTRELTSAIQMAPLRFSPEGDRILVSQKDHDNVPSLWTVNAFSSDTQRLVTGASWGDWQWQPTDH
jgi:Tol biopolymer transport system component